MKTKKTINLLSALVSLMLICSCGNNTNQSDSNTHSGDTSTTNDSGVSSSSTTPSGDAETIFNEALNKDYSNMTYSENMTITYSGISFDISTISLVTDDAYQISTMFQGESEDFYVEYLDDGVKLYEYDGSKWSFKTLTEAEWLKTDSYGNYIYFDYMLTVLNPNEFDIKYSSFDYVNGKYVCKSNELQSVGSAIANDSSSVYSSVDLSIKNGYVSEINIDFTMDLQGEKFIYSVQVTYEDIGSTIVVLPSTSVEGPSNDKDYDFINPTLAKDLTSKQSTDLTLMLKAAYDNYSCDYAAIDSDGYSETYETLLLDGNKYDIDGYYYQEENYYLYHYYLEETTNDVFLYDLDDNGIVRKTSLDDEGIYTYAPYGVVPSALGLSASYFGYYEGVYVCKPAGLTAITNSWGIDDCTIVSLEITMDDTGKAQSMKIVYDFEAYNVSYYTTEMYVYYDINSTTVTLPAANQNPVSKATASQLTSFNDATKVSFDNVTIYDNIFDALMTYKDGIIEQLMVINNSYYLSTYLNENGTYYSVAQNGSKTPFPINGYYIDDVIPILNFAAIDTSKLLYNSFDKTYEIAYSDVDITKFLNYYSELEGSFDGISKIVFALDRDGHFSTIDLYIVIDGEEYKGYGLELYDYGNTTLISDLLG